jgi:hypothetical protein
MKSKQYQLGTLVTIQRLFEDIEKLGGKKPISNTTGRRNFRICIDFCQLSGKHKKEIRTISLTTVLLYH